MDFAQLHDGHIGVDLRGVKTGVAKQLLDVTDVGAVLQHVRGARMTKLMAGAGSAKGGGHDAANPVAKIPGGETFAVTAKKQGALALRRLQQEARPLQVCLLYTSPSLRDS